MGKMVTRCDHCNVQEYDYRTTCPYCGQVMRPATHPANHED